MAYTYDSEGRKVKETTADTVRQFLVDRLLPYGQVTLETDGTGDMVTEYVYGLERISQERGGFAHWYLADGQGSVRQLADSAGGVTDTYAYTAFGEPLALTGSTANDFRYVGEQADSISGLYYLRARWMDPKNGRFTAVDPFEGFNNEPLTLHRYFYANGSPVSFIDPTGELVKLQELTLAGAIQGTLLSLYLIHTQLINSSTDLPEKLVEDGINYKRKKSLGNNKRIYIPENAPVEVASYLLVLASKGSTRDGDKFGLVAGNSSGRMDQGSQETARRLGCAIAPGNANWHAEESIMYHARDRGWKVLSIGVTQGVCDGIKYPGHNCMELLNGEGVAHNNEILAGMARVIRSGASNEVVKRVRAYAVGAYEDRKK